MADQPAFNLNRLFDGSLRRLRTEAEFFSRQTDHRPELGRSNEGHLLKLLRSYLPPKIGLGTGFIVSGGTEPRQSPQCDIVLYDALNNTPLYASDTFSIYPIEMVYGVVEVKTTLNDVTLEQAFERCAEIRSMARMKDGNGNKAYLCQLPPEPKTPARYCKYVDKLAPRFFVFAYGGWATAAALRTNFKRLTNKYRGAHLHGVCMLDTAEGQLIRHEAFKSGDDRIVHFAENGFRQFLMRLPVSLDSMLPLHRRGSGFDAIDLDHYAVAADLPDGELVDAGQDSPAT